MTTRKTKFFTRIALAVLAVMMTCTSAWAQEQPILSISSADDWNTFVTNVSNGTTYSGQTVTLTADIPVSSMVGLPGSINNQFQGTFDGGGHTLTFNYTTTEGVCAPFRYVYNATIQDLHVDGDINTSDMYAAGIVGAQYGTLTLSNCRSSVNINCSIAGNCSIGGLVGLVYQYSSTTIEGCVFDGSLISVGEYLSTNCGGFIGYTYSTYTIRNSFLVPSKITIGFGEGNEPSFVFARPSTGTSAEGSSITNCYWLHNDLLATYNYQGKPVYSIKAGENITVANAGSVSNNYAYSGLTLYNTGIKFNNVLYAASADVVSLTLNNTPEEGYVFDHYEASAGTLTGSGNPYSLTMPCEQDVVINGVFIAPINYMNADGSIGYKAANEYTVLTSGAATSLEAGWYVVNSDIDYTGKVTLNGDVTIILCNGCTMNVGTEGSPISGQGLDAQNLTIYGQTLDENTAGKLSVYCNDRWASACNATNYVQNSGNVVVVNTNNEAGGTQEGIGANITINGGKFYASADVRSLISSNININGGKVTTIGSIHALNNSTVTISWTNANDYFSATGFTAYKVSLAKPFTDGTYIHSGTADIDHSYGIRYKTIRPCVTRTIAAATNWDNHESTADGWAFISSPLTTPTAPSTINYATTSSGNTTIQGSMILTGEDEANYDLYRFNQSASAEWENYKAHTTDFNFVNGQGYLYANKDAKTLVFSGDNLNTSTVDVVVNLTYSASNPHKRWNLIGNPFVTAATLNKPFYRMNETGTALSAQVEANNPVDVMEGVFVQASFDGETATFTPSSNSGAKGATPMLNISVNKGGVSTGSTTLDNAIVRFDGGQTLGKFTLHEDDSKLYISQDGHDYAIANATTENELPLNFKAINDGTYTLTVKPEGMEMNYLHLIDNKTGIDIDLMATPSYTFEAKNSDYPSRFRLMFNDNGVDGPSTGSETFAFIDANGNIIINNTGNNATLQVIDMLGHVLSSETIVGNATISTEGLGAGVYVMRLVNGEDVMVQKIVVR